MKIGIVRLSIAICLNLEVTKRLYSTNLQANYFLGKSMDDSIIIQEIKDWFSSCLGCVAGRREFNQNRYMISIVRSQADALSGFKKFTECLEVKSIVACLFICPPENEKSFTVSQEIRRLAALFSPLTDFSAEELATGSALNKKISLTCPVTNTAVLFEDFDAVAFCPQSDNINDELYDPLMSTPISAVNFSSDIYAFSIFTRDISLQKFNREVYALASVERQQLYASVMNSWQKVAEKSIKNFIDMTDTDKCPVYLAGENKYWYANHQDPAFAESVKELYRHDMPVIYVPKIFCEWEQFFTMGRTPNFSETAASGSQEVESFNFEKQDQQHD